MYTDPKKAANKQDTTRGGWSQMAVDVFKQLAPCENHSLFGWMVQETNVGDETVPLILSYHEDGLEVCINQELVNLGMATSDRFEKKIMQGKNIYT